MQSENESLGINNSVEDLNEKNKENELRRKVLEVLYPFLECSIEDISDDNIISNMGIDSITFVEMLVALECEFDFEFDTKKLVITAFPTINSLIDYVLKKIS